MAGSVLKSKIKFVCLGALLVVLPLWLSGCSGCRNESRQTAQPHALDPRREQKLTGPSDSPPPGLEEGDLGPTDEIETPEERALDPSTEPDLD